MCACHMLQSVCLWHNDGLASPLFCHDIIFAACKMNTLVMRCNEEVHSSVPLCSLATLFKLIVLATSTQNILIESQNIFIWHRLFSNINSRKYGHSYSLSFYCVDTHPNTLFNVCFCSMHYQHTINPGGVIYWMTVLYYTHTISLGYKNNQSLL